MPDKREKQAIIYVAGLGLGITPQKTPQGVVRRIARALDLEAATHPVEFPVRLRDDAVAPVPGGSMVGTISRKEGSAERPILDCYAYEWADLLRARWREQPAWKRFLRVCFTLTNAWTFLKFFWRSGRKNPTGVAQGIVAGLGVAVLVAYAVILGFAVTQTALEYKDEVVDDRPAAQVEESLDAERTDNKAGNKRGRGPVTDTEAAAQPEADEGEDPTWQQWAALFGAGAAIALPKLRRRIVLIGSGLGAVASYIRVGEGKPQVTGGLTALINDITRDRNYDRITVIAYSFGSIVALDTFFPTTEKPAKSLDRVDTLVTIGCPYDFVTALDKTWSRDRHVRASVARNWINIFSSIDLMGSNYRGDTKTEPPDRGLNRATEASTGPVQDGEGTNAQATNPVAPDSNIRWDLGIQPRLINVLEFHGFASHGLYWGRDTDLENNVFTAVVTSAFRGQDFLE